ncbi:hypothetical protein B0H12DRAFT_1107614 [Mycena haematopus]|nr:hypothetical protein B0H12DRAFT_1107614 [Mycena haematopus]
MSSFAWQNVCAMYCMHRTREGTRLVYPSPPVSPGCDLVFLGALSLVAGLRVWIVRETIRNCWSCSASFYPMMSAECSPKVKGNSSRGSSSVFWRPSSNFKLEQYPVWFVRV